MTEQSELRSDALTAHDRSEIAFLCETNGYKFQPFSPERKMWFGRAHAVLTSTRPSGVVANINPHLDRIWRALYHVIYSGPPEMTWVERDQYKETLEFIGECRDAPASAPSARGDAPLSESQIAANRTKGSCIK